MSDTRKRNPTPSVGTVSLKSKKPNKKAIKAIEETHPSDVKENNDADIDDDNDDSQFIEEDEELEDNESYASVGEDEEDDDDKCDDDLSMVHTPDEDEEMLSEASIQRRKDLDKETSRKQRASQHEKLVEKSTSRNAPLKKLVIREPSIVEISSGEEPLITKSSGKLCAYVETVIDEDDAVNEDTYTKPARLIEKSEKTGMSIPHTPMRKRELVSDASDTKPKM
ncbi:hypothetical protein JAAARDRAFT_199783 [Jaapia argillacea MUCL 33604]|uniref:Uncharacterized protein n=1 Tax=Jaapia argillacea MUCL 33604 TaxID=933084 RepID=A0A067PHZ0_9AGAM|nr:hypothetical protein JAAARDRAFT_199783 [Jaapia argillacea MUCL 33604]